MKLNITYALLTASLVAVPVIFNTGCAVTQGRETAGAYAKDKTIATKIKTALYSDPVVKGTQINVTALNGEVQLSGFVETEEAKQRAEDIASKTEGVIAVHNSLLLPTGKSSGSSNSGTNSIPDSSSAEKPSRTTTDSSSKTPEQK